jgi:hypothetical protein
VLKRGLAKRLSAVFVVDIEAMFEEKSKKKPAGTSRFSPHFDAATFHTRFSRQELD